MTCGWWVVIAGYWFAYKSWSAISGLPPKRARATHPLSAPLMTTSMVSLLYFCFVVAQGGCGMPQLAATSPVAGITHQVRREWQFGKDIYVKHEASDADLNVLKEHYQATLSSGQQKHVIFHCLQHGEKLVAIYDSNPATNYDRWEIIPLKQSANSFGRCKDEPDPQPSPAIAKEPTAKDVLVQYFATISTKKFKEAYQLRSRRTRKGYSLEEFEASWDGNALVEVLSANTVKDSVTVSKLQVRLKYTNFEGLVTTDAGQVKLLKEEGGWRFDGGELTRVSNPGPPDTTNWESTRWGIDPNDPRAAEEFRRGEKAADKQNTWLPEREADRIVDKLWEADVTAYPDIVAYRFGFKSRMEKKFARKW